MVAVVSDGRLDRQERKFFAGAALAMIAVIAFGFAPTFYLRGVLPTQPRLEPLIPLVILHGLLFTTWLLLFAAQAWLVALGRIDLHRKLGTVGFLLLPLLVIVATLTALGAVGRPLSAPPGIDPRAWLAVPLLDVPVFTILIGLGLSNRSRPQRHKRFLYVAMADMMAPGFGRIHLPVAPALHAPLGLVVLPDLFLVALIAWDIRSTGRPQTLTLAASLAVVLVQLLKPMVWMTPAWLAFAGWISAPFT